MLNSTISQDGAAANALYKPSAWNLKLQKLLTMQLADCDDCTSLSTAFVLNARLDEKNIPSIRLFVFLKQLLSALYF